MTKDLMERLGLRINELSYDRRYRNVPADSLALKALIEVVETLEKRIDHLESTSTERGGLP